MATPQPLPLQERVPAKNKLQRVVDVVILSLLLSLLLYRLSSLRARGSVWLIALLCELWFTFVWVLNMNAKWTPLTYKTYPERLSKRLDDLPTVDMFVTTADPKLEPPIITVNTVLSLLAVEYPAHKLACYVSDDACSPVTFYALVEASKFGELWVPFCKRHNVRVRAPFVYFSAVPEGSGGLATEEFMHEWRYMKNEYEELARRIESASAGKICVVSHMDGELAEFEKVERGNNPSIVKVIWENKELEGGIPHLIYVAREKRPKHPHHYKAGAMNVLTRVSGVMTNAPFILNVDCDMFANNPEVFLHGMCLLLGFDKEVFSGFVQTIQQFYSSLKDDPFGNQLVVLQRKLGVGVCGIQGPFYAGTGCFHRRKVIYGSSPELGETNGYNDRLSNDELKRVYGYSIELIESANQITSRNVQELPVHLHGLSSKIEAAKEVSYCTYELNTWWGKEIGFVYGSMTEDVLTGLRIHSKGWRSVYLTLEPAPFLGNAPTGGPASLTQYKRWATGLFEIILGRHSPVLAALTKKLGLRQCLSYVVICVWALRSVPELCYALIPAYCLLTNTSFLPKPSEPAFIIPAAAFAIVNAYNLIEYLQCGLSVRSWWNNQRMQRIYSITAWLLGFFSVALKILGISETVFELTRKDQNSSDNDDNGADPGWFTFDSSPMFVSGTALLLLHLTAISTSMVRLASGGVGAGLGELVCSAWVLLSFSPFVKGFVRKGRYGIPWAVVWKAAALDLVFLQFIRS